MTRTILIVSAATLLMIGCGEDDKPAAEEAPTEGAAKATEPGEAPGDPGRPTFRTRESMGWERQQVGQLPITVELPAGGKLGEAGPLTVISFTEPPLVLRFQRMGKRLISLQQRLGNAQSSGGGAEIRRAEEHWGGYELEYERVDGYGYDREVFIGDRRYRCFYDRAEREAHLMGMKVCSTMGDLDGKLARTDAPKRELKAREDGTMPRRSGRPSIPRPPK